MNTSNAVPKCQHCGQDGGHTGKCHLVKAIEYYENGTVKRVEYLTPADSMPPFLPSWPATPPATPPYTPPFTPTWGGSGG